MSASFFFFVFLPLLDVGAKGGGAPAQMPNNTPSQLSESQIPAVGTIYGGGLPPVPVRGSLSFELPSAIDSSTNQSSQAKPKGGLTQRPSKSAAGDQEELSIDPRAAHPVSFDNTREESRLDSKKTDGLSESMRSSRGIADRQAKFSGAGAGAGAAGKKVDDLEGQTGENGAKLNEAEEQARAELEARQLEMERQKMEMMSHVEGDLSDKAPPGLLKKIMGYINFVEAKRKRLENARAEAEALVEAKKEELDRKRAKMENHFNEKRDQLEAEMKAETEKKKAECKARGEKFKGQGLENLAKKKAALEKAHKKMEQGLDDAENTLGAEKPWMDPDDDIILLHLKILDEEDSSDSESDYENTGKQAAREERESQFEIKDLEEEKICEYTRKKAEFAEKGIEYKGQGLEVFDTRKKNIERRYRKKQEARLMTNLGIEKSAQDQLALADSSSSDEDELSGIRFRQWSFTEHDFILNAQFLLRKIYYRQNMVTYIPHQGLNSHFLPWLHFHSSFCFAIVCTCTREVFRKCAIL